MHYSDKMKNEAARLASVIANLNNELAKLPKGTLRIWKNGKGKSYRHYIELDGKRHSLPMSQKALIVQLARKNILKKMLQDAQREKEAIESYLKKHRDGDSVTEYLAKEPYIEELVRPLFQIRDERLQKWAEADYPSTAGHTESLIHKGPRGQKFRSKSEAQIANALYKNKIAYRYEMDHTINGITYHIDFTICHPKTGETYYWEHLGMIDSESYNHRFAGKLADYESDGIFPGINLILTYESRKFPLSISMIDEIIEEWFLQD